MRAIPALLLTLLMTFGALGPEAGHSLAHRQAGGHPDHDLAGHADLDPTTGVGLTDGHSADDHPHFELAARLPGKSTLAFAVVVQPVSRPLPIADGGLRVPTAIDQSPPPRDHRHGPPPPTRAPPLA